MYCTQIKTKSGKKRWECIADAPPNPVTGKRNQIKRRGKTQKEAKQKVRDEIAKQTETRVDPKQVKGVTFDQLAAKWLEMYRVTKVKGNTIDIRMGQIKRLNEKMAKIPIDKLTHLFFQSVINDVFSDGTAKNTLLGIKACANLIFKFAVKYNYMTVNPAKDIVIPEKPKTIEDLQKNSIEEKYWERKELDTFLDGVLKYGLELDKERFYTLAFSGMRVGELNALQKQDLDFDRNQIRIYKTISGHNENMRTYDMGTTKNSTARTIDMEQPIMDMLRELVRKNDEHKMKYRTLIDDFHDADFVFQHKNGYPYFRGTVNDRIKRILRLIGSDKHATSHIFRHTHISMLTEAGVDLPTIMQKVGHSDPKTTMGIYTHVTNKMKENASEKIRGNFDEMLQKISL
ncbi:tyrosine-type recombinase/integrase [Virgibacillus doumboii]|uniref:tyrosine-type recombinase/integrase n=1 Tax=Virgibacillus doumboii TaxID=2697503 RepID=UPI0013E013E4|nr:site-specific integrase [Virgibacillus doumboii]